MIYFGIAAGIFAGDFFLKRRAQKWRMNEERPAAGGRLVFRRSHNAGAFLGWGKGRAGLVRALSLFLTAAAALLLCVTLGKRGNGLLKTGLSLLLGGAFSNTWDRLRQKYVVDYFSFRTGFPALDRVVFNLSDFAILAGTAFCAAWGMKER